MDKPITGLEELKPYSKEAKPYTNPSYEQMKHNLIPLFEYIDREALKRYVDRAYTEWYNQKDRMV